MKEKQLDNSKFIIPAAIVFWLVGIFVFKNETPDWLKIVTAVVLFLAIVILVGFLFLRQSSWRKLAQKFPSTQPFTGLLKTCQTAVIDSISITAPNYTKPKVRLNFIVKVGSDADALYISTIKIFRALLPTIQIPYSAITSTRYFDAAGWVKAPSSPGSLINLQYDPGYKGQFLEIEISEPKIFIQLPASQLTEAIQYLPIVTFNSQNYN